MTIEELKIDEGLRERTIIIPFSKYSNETPSPIVSVSIFGQKAFMLVDTGADISYLTDNFFYQYLPDDIVSCGKYDIVGLLEDVTGNEVFNIPVLIENIEVDHRFIVGNINMAFEELEEKHNIILAGIIGADLISKMGMCIDFMNNVIWFKSNCYDN